MAESKIDETRSEEVEKSPLTVKIEKLRGNYNDYKIVAALALTNAVVVSTVCMEEIQKADNSSTGKLALLGIAVLTSVGVLSGIEAIQNGSELAAFEALQYQTENMSGAPQLNEVVAPETGHAVTD